jgi:hypothetical protein
MATLLLTAVGTLVGGPIGGAIGAAIGNTIDRSIFTPDGAKGARLDSLALQGSSYGSDLPKLFGTMRVAGSVIWSTDLQESKHKSSAGKGQPKTTSYSYSASFAVALSARPIRAIHRIWADGALLRGAAGDWKSDVGAFRIYPGDEGQAVDPLIAAAQGLATTPAHRGLAYVVFEQLQLADYGNRIPSLSFEIEADGAPVALATIAETLSDGDIAGTGGPLLAGYAASGDSLRGAIEGLATALPVAFTDGPDGVTLVDETATPIVIAAAELGSAADGKVAAKLVLDRQAAGTLNAAIAISYYDPARDYQLGSQSAHRDASARRAGAIDLAAAVDAASAKAIAEARLAREWAGRTTATVTLPWRRLDIGAGALLSLPGQDGIWRVTMRGFEAMLATLTAQRLPGDAPAVPIASPGAGVTEVDLPAGPTTLALLDLPSFGDDLPSVPTLLVAAAGASAGWRKATLIASLDDGASWQTIGQTAAAAVIGTVAEALPPGSTMLRDAVTTLDVELIEAAMVLGGSDVTEASATANLALIGDELVQFATATQTGARTYRLAGLLRGRRGTEWAMATHVAGERFILVDADTLLAWTLPTSAIGSTVRVAATGVGDVTPAEASIVFQARALRPPSPVALRATTELDGSILVGWTRRSRAGWTWLDDIDAPLGEEAERYRLTATRGSGASVSIDTAAPAATITAADLAAIGGSGALSLAVVQIGTAAATLPPAVLTLMLGA